MQLNITPLEADASERIISRIIKEHECSRELAEAILHETLTFMHVSVHNLGQGLGPSPIVDIGWHTFILHTVAYTEYCQAAFGFYLHHNPFTESEQRTIARPITDTVEFMEQNGIVYDPKLWESAACCSPGFCNTDAPHAKAECDNKCSPPTEHCDSGRIVNYGDLLAYTAARVDCTVDCDGGNGGGPSGCGPGGGGGCS